MRMMRLIVAGLVAAATMGVPRVAHAEDPMAGIEHFRLDKNKVCTSVEKDGPRYCVLPENLLDAMQAANQILFERLQAAIDARKKRCTATLEVLPQKRVFY